MLLAAPPGWWTAPQTSIIEANSEPNDFGPANSGQLKFVAKQARRHLDLSIPGGAGTAIASMVDGFEPGDDEYGPINLGQLKAVAKPFYDRLLAIGYDTRQSLRDHGTPDWAFVYPWDPATAASENYAPANIGQLKWVFSFDLTGFIVDDDGNGLGDDWENTHFGSTGQEPTADPDHDGLTNQQEFAGNLDPKNSDTDWDGIGDAQEIADGTSPANKDSFTPRRIAYFPLDATNFVSAEGQLPRTPATGLTAASRVTGFRGFAARFEQNGRVLAYDWKRSDGAVNYSFARGSVRLWIKPDWSSAQMSGTCSRLFEVGGPWGWGKAYALLRLHASQPTMAFSLADGSGHSLDYEHQTHFNWASGTWHQVVLTYAPTSRKIYVDGMLLGEASANWTHPLKVDDILSNGLNLGNESPGFQPVYGAIDEVECFNYELSASTIAQDYANSLSSDSDDDGLPDWWEQQVIGAGLTDQDGDGDVDVWDVRPNDDFDGDGVSNYGEWTNGTAPSDYFNGSNPAAPATPANLTVQGASPSSISLSWIDTSNNEKQFIVQRSTDAGAHWQELAALARNTTQFADGSVAAGVLYTYRILARNPAGDSGRSNQVTTTVDSDGDGVPDGQDPYPNDPATGTAPVITILSPSPGAVLTTSSVTVTATVAAEDTLDDVRINSVLVSGSGTYSRTLSLNEGQQEIIVSARTAGGRTAQSRLPISVDAYPPDVTIISPMDEQVIFQQNVRVRVLAESTSADVKVNGFSTTRNGYYYFAWVSLAPGENTITAVLNENGQQASDAVTVLFEPPGGYDSNADDDGDSVPNGQDQFPDDPGSSTDADGDGVPAGQDSDDNDATIAGSVRITAPPNGIIIEAQ